MIGKVSLVVWFEKRCWKLFSTLHYPVPLPIIPTASLSSQSVLGLFFLFKLE